MLATVLLMMACGFLAGQFHHVLGVAPILGAILCAACFLRPKELFLVGLGGILFRDLLLGFSTFTLVRLVGMAMVVGMILLLRVRPTLRSLFAGLLLSSPIFHLTLAVGDWLTGTCSILPKNAQGLWLTIVSAAPYFQRSFIGDIFFTSVFLSLYTLAAYTVLGLETKGILRDN